MLSHKSAQAPEIHLNMEIIDGRMGIFKNITKSKKHAQRLIKLHNCTIKLFNILWIVKFSAEFEEDTFFAYFLLRSCRGYST